MNNTDLQVRFSKETKQQVLQTGKQMNLYYTDEYVRWLEDIALKQANDADTGQDKCHIQRASNRTLIYDELVLLKKREFINKDGDWCDADELVINGDVKYFAYKSDLYGC